MIVDTSAIFAILQYEPERDRFKAAIDEAERLRISAVSAFEARMVATSRTGAEGRLEMDLFLSSFEIVPFDAAQAEAAAEAFRRFGKGRHPAGLNLGDCCAYALAVTSGEALLFKGGDFALTDVAAA